MSDFSEVTKCPFCKQFYAPSDGGCTCSGALVMDRQIREEEVEADLAMRCIHSSTCELDGPCSECESFSEEAEDYEDYEQYDSCEDDDDYEG